MSEHKEPSVVERAIVPGKDEDSYGEWPDLSQLTEAGACPDCGAPNRFCVCVLRARMENAERRLRQAEAGRGRYLRLWQFAASCLNHNADRLRKPRGKDEARMLAAAQRDMLGVAWAGTTDGWLDGDAEPKAAESPDQALPLFAAGETLPTDSNDPC